MIQTAVALDKPRLREKALLRRSAAAASASRQSLAAATDAAFEAICARVFSGPSVGRVALYHAIRDETPTAELALRLRAAGLPLALPAVPAPNATPVFRAWEPDAPLEPDACGVPSPTADAAAVRPCVIVAPLVGFDRRGGRLGYGGGYYDRAIADARARGPVFTLGLAFSRQELERVPTEGHDARLDAVATEQGLVLFD